MENGRSGFTRRQALCRLGLVPPLVAALLTRQAAAQEAPGGEVAALKERARRKGVRFGAAVQAVHLRTDAALADAVVRECDLVVPEWEMKWAAIERERGRRSYADADAIQAFARRHGMRMRGHTVVWGRSTPPWAVEALTAPNGRAVFDDNIDQFMTHYRDTGLDSIDVVNEAIEPNDDRDDRLRDSVYLKAFGPSYLADAFFRAHEADPAARLFYNDYGVDYPDRYARSRREGVLDLMRRLKAEKVPIQGVGIQGHLRAWEDFDADSFRTFLADLASLGLEVAITEFDVNDLRIRGDVGTRDEAVAAHARAYLDAAFDEPAVRSLLVWSLSDRYSWLNRNAARKRSDGQPIRGHPLDEAMQRKPLWHAIAAALDSAAPRS